MGYSCSSDDPIVPEPEPLNHAPEISVVMAEVNVWGGKILEVRDSKLIDFLCRPDIAQRNCEYIYYSSPNSGAIELMGDEYTENSTINPSEDVIARCEFYHDLDDKTLSIYNNFWEQAKSNVN